MHDVNAQRRSAVLSEDDPRRLAPTIRPIQPPSVAQLVERHQSRF